MIQLDWNIYYIDMTFYMGIDRNRWARAKKVVAVRFFTLLNWINKCYMI